MQQCRSLSRSMQRAIYPLRPYWVMLLPVAFPGPRLQAQLHACGKGWRCWIRSCRPRSLPLGSKPESRLSCSPLSSPSHLDSTPRQLDSASTGRERTFHIKLDSSTGLLFFFNDQGDVLSICSIIIFHPSKQWNARFFILCDVIFLVRLQGKFEIDHSNLEVKG